jgi:hypothetical protein
MDEATREYYRSMTGETNPVGDIHAEFLDRLTDRTVMLSDPDLVKIDRLRIIGFNKYEYPRWDLSYCYGTLKNGDLIRVDLDDPGYIKGNYKAHLVELCQKAGKFGKDLGIFDAVSTLPG